MASLDSYVSPKLSFEMDYFQTIVLKENIISSGCVLWESCLKIILF